MILPGNIGLAVSSVGIIWFLVAGFIAARQALDIDNLKTFGTICIVFVALLIIRYVLARIGLGALLGAGLF
jgi:hypothetical protein